MLIGSSNSLSWFQEMNKKSDGKSKSYDPHKAQVFRTKYQPYSLLGYHFLAVNGGRGHFSVVSVNFDMKNDNIIDKVCVYNSLRRSMRNNESPKEDSVPGMLLIQLQQFLSHYCFFGTQKNEVLTTNANFLLSFASYANCPQQRNGFDCGLFALDTLIHLVGGHLEVENAFGPEHVTRLREGLYSRLTSSGEVTWDFLCSFFPRLCHESTTVQSALIPLVHEEKETAIESQESTGTTYQQAYHAIEGFNRRKSEEDVSSFQLVIPYIQKFVDTNEGSIAEYEVEGDVHLSNGHLSMVFVCPAFMNSAIRYARPVMSLDAAHLKSKWWGTLYVTSVKTPCDEIFPVAMAIMNDNENEAGWTWFLELLRSACEFLVVDHPKASVAYKYFSFISDRQKGVIKP
jgi:hypothetical protein